MDEPIEVTKQRRTVTIGNIIEFCKAIASRVNPNVPGRIVKLRLNSCFGHETGEACPHRRYTQSPEGRIYAYCGGCGCGSDKDLGESIVTYPYLRCPLSKPGFGKWWEGENK